MIYRYFFLAFFLLGLSFTTQANIGVSPMVIDLFDKTTTTEVAVKNFDNQHNAYVEITPYRLTQPESPNGPKSRVRHPEKDGLVVFPAKLILLPGQTQFVRIVKTAKNITAEHVYEVDFIPKVSTYLSSKKSGSTPALGIRVVVGYGTRVTLRPDTLSPSLSVKRLKNKLVIKNTGNTSLSILSCRQQLEGKTQEVALPAYTLFVGQTIETKLNQLVQVTLDASYMGKSLGSFHTD